MKAKMLIVILSFYLVSCSDLGPVDISSASKESFTILHSGARKIIGSTTTTYDVDPTVIGYFGHYWQNQTPSLLTTNQAANSCGATMYMMASNCMALYKGISYGITKEKQKAIYNKTVIPGVPYTDLYRLWLYYGQKDDVNTVRSQLSGGTYDREVLKQTIEKYLEENKIVLVGVNAYVVNASALVHTDPYYSTSASVNPDLDGPMSSQKYITGEAVGTVSGSYKVGGHIIGIIGITKNNSTGTGVVTYIDPISKTRATSNRKYVNYTRLLNAIIANSSGQYKVLAIGPKL